MAKGTPADQRRLYGDLAWTWPLFSPKEDYVEEAEQISRGILERLRLPTGTLLHLGCGGGHLDYTLKRFFAVTGVDVSDSMLELARTLNPEVQYLHGDMRVVRLGRLFDAVLIEDSIAYMLSEEELRAAFATAWAHLRPGGVFHTVAEFARERFRENETSSSAHADDKVEIAVLENVHDPDPTDTTFEYFFVTVVRRAGRVQVETDQHLCGLFGLETWRRLLRDVGFAVTEAEMLGYPAFLCDKPLA